MTSSGPALLQVFARGERLLPVPATLDLQCGGSPCKLSVEMVLRLLPRKRLVVRARWNGRMVAVKLFAVAAHGQRHAQRERAGLDAVLRAGLLAPSILGECRSHDGAYVGLIYEWVDTAPALLQLWPQCDLQQKRLWLQRLLEVMGRLHAHGACQSDIHLGNFLVRDDGLWLLDLGTIDTSASALNQVQSLENLGALAAQLPLADRSLLDALLPGYLQARGWRDDARSRNRYRNARNRFWRERWRDYLDKSLRDCSLTQYQRSFSAVIAVRRAALGNELLRFCSNPDVALGSAEILKSGNTATVGRTRLDGAAVVIKRYNIKNWRHALSRMWRPTRAEHSWRFAHLLEVAGIRSPRPLALVEQRCGVLRGRAWLVCDAIVGESLLSVGQRGTLSAVVLQSLRELLFALRDERISHGDFKATNFIVDPHGSVALIDLDAMRKHRTDAGFRGAFARDLQRLQRNWAEAEPVRAQIDALVTELLT